MNRVLAAPFLFLTLLPAQAWASWFESCELQGLVSAVSPAIPEGSIDRSATLTVSSADRSNDNLGKASYSPCWEHIDKEYKVTVPAAVQDGDLVTVVRTAVDGTDPGTGTVSRTIKFKFLASEPRRPER